MSVTDLYRLVYYSKNRIPGDDAMVADEIRTILAKSQRNNSSVDVTGALMFNHGCFAQVLEGPRDSLETTFERIQRDDRHGEVTLLQFAPAPHRGFPAWSMTFAGGSTADQVRYAHVAQESGFDPARLSGDNLFQILHDLVLEEENRSAA